MTEDEARKKWCPVSGGAPPQLVVLTSNCIASGCMAWRTLPPTATDFGARIRAFIQAEQYVSAIKEWRAEYGSTLKEGKDAIDEIRAGTRPFPAGGSAQGYCGMVGVPR